MGLQTIRSQHKSQYSLPNLNEMVAETDFGDDSMALMPYNERLDLSFQPPINVEVDNLVTQNKGDESQRHLC